MQLEKLGDNVATNDVDGALLPTIGRLLSSRRPTIADSCLQLGPSLGLLPSTCACVHVALALPSLKLSGNPGSAAIKISTTAPPIDEASFAYLCVTLGTIWAPVWWPIPPSVTKEASSTIIINDRKLSLSLISFKFCQIFGAEAIDGLQGRGFSTFRLLRFGNSARDDISRQSAV